MKHEWPEGMMEELDQFFATQGSLAVGQNLYREVFDSPLFFPLQRAAELAWMVRRMRSRSPRVVMEIGSDKGGGFYHFIKGLPTVQRAVACEFRGVPWSQHFEHAFPDKDFLWLEGCSRVGVDRVRSWLGYDRIDVLFIDGDKTAFDKDFYAYLPLMAKSSLVFMHDIQDDPMGAAFDLVRKDYRSEAYVDTTDSREGTTPHAAWLRYWDGRSCGVGAIYL